MHVINNCNSHPPVIAILTLTTQSPEPPHRQTKVIISSFKTVSRTLNTRGTITLLFAYYQTFRGYESSERSFLRYGGVEFAALSHNISQLTRLSRGYERSERGYMRYDGLGLLVLLVRCDYCFSVVFVILRRALDNVCSAVNEDFVGYSGIQRIYFEQDSRYLQRSHTACCRSLGSQEINYETSSERSYMRYDDMGLLALLGV